MRRLLSLRAQLNTLKRQQQQAVDDEQRLLDILYLVPGKEISDRIQAINQRIQWARRGQALLEQPFDLNDAPLSQVEKELKAAQQHIDQVRRDLETLYSSQGALEQNIAHLSPTRVPQ